MNLRIDWWKLPFCGFNIFKSPLHQSPYPKNPKVRKISTSHSESIPWKRTTFLLISAVFHQNPSWISLKTARGETKSCLPALPGWSPSHIMWANQLSTGMLTNQMWDTVHQQWHWGTLRISIYLYIYLYNTWWTHAQLGFVWVGGQPLRRGASCRSLWTPGRSAHKKSLNVSERDGTCRGNSELCYPLVNVYITLHNYGKSPVFMGKSTINHHFRHFPWALGCRPLQWCFLGSLWLVTCRMFVDLCDFRWPPDGGWPSHTLWIIVGPHWWLVCWNHFLSDLWVVFSQNWGRYPMCQTLSQTIYSKPGRKSCFKFWDIPCFILFDFVGTAGWEWLVWLITTRALALGFLHVMRASKLRTHKRKQKSDHLEKKHPYPLLYAVLCSIWVQRFVLEGCGHYSLLVLRAGLGPELPLWIWAKRRPPNDQHQHHENEVPTNSMVSNSKRKCFPLKWP